jgi:hypothetical protein
MPPRTRFKRAVRTGVWFNGGMRVALAAACFVSQALFDLPASAWGGAGHEAITRLAAQRLDDDCLKNFFTAHLSTVVVESTAPDRWKETDPDEGSRHYLNLDVEARAGDYPHVYSEAVRRYGLDAAVRQGLVPWRAEEMATLLFERFSRSDARGAAETAGHLSHYIGDAYSPLHSTRNYDGQLTGNPGLHARWESDMPYTFRRELEDAAARRAPPLPTANAMEGAFSALQTGLDAMPEIVRVDLDTGGDPRSLYDAQGEVVSERWAKAAALLASLWIDAWLRAGRPALEGMPAACFTAPSTSSVARITADGGAVPPGILIISPQPTPPLGPVQGGGGCSVGEGPMGPVASFVLWIMLLSLLSRRRTKQ